MRRFHGFDTDSARWDAFEFREGDIVISAPMKAGTTWTQMICALLVFQTSDLPAPLGELSPWLDMQTRPIEDVRRALEEQTHRRFIKTHSPLDCLPLDDRVTYVGVGRHPLDLVRSAARHSANIDFERTLDLVSGVVGADEAIARLVDRPIPSQDPEERLRFFLDEDHPADKALTLHGVMEHYRTFVEVPARVVRVHYSDLCRDLGGEMRRLAAELGIDVEADRWPSLVEAASFPSMKARAAELRPDAGLGLFKDADSFFAVAGEGEWKQLDPALIDRFETRLAETDPSGRIGHWACHGLYS